MVQKISIFSIYSNFLALVYCSQEYGISFREMLVNSLKKLSHEHPYYSHLHRMEEITQTDSESLAKSKSQSICKCLGIYGKAVSL